MTKHELRVEVRGFDAVASGIKSFEVCNDEADVRVGDSVLIREYDSTEYLDTDWTDAYGNFPAEPPVRRKGYTGRYAFATVVYVLRAEDCPIALKEGYAVLGLKIIDTQGFSFNH